MLENIFSPFHPSQLKAWSDSSRPRYGVFTPDMTTDGDTPTAQTESILALCYARVLKL